VGPASNRESNAFTDKEQSFQAAMGHSFGLPEIKALQSVTSVPAKSLQQDHRIGYVKPGYDADLVVWDSHPLSVGATPLQVYVDGKATLDPKKVDESMPKSRNAQPLASEQPRIRPSLSPDAKDELCKSLAQPGAKIALTGITRSFLSEINDHTEQKGNLTVIIDKGRAVCFDLFDVCASDNTWDHIIHLNNGHLSPGLTTVSRSLGLREIASESSTGDGATNKNSDVANPGNVVFAKYGVHLEGRGFDRAKIGGVTRSVTIPLTQGGFLGGVSVGIKTSEKNTILNGGIFQSEVGLHLFIGQTSKGWLVLLFFVLDTDRPTESDSTPSISSAVSKLRHILRDNNSTNNIFGSAAKGSMPLVIHANNKVCLHIPHAK
jgi:hypothetical protein